MQSKALTVDDYLKEVPVKRLEALTKIRELCLKELKGVSVGKGCIRYTNPEKIDFAVVQKMLAETFRSKNIIFG
jgi:hypothetical protein